MPDTVALGEVWVGSERTVDVKVASTGAGPVRFAAPAWDAALLAVTWDEAPDGFALSSAESRVLRVSWRPTAPGPLATTLTLTSDLLADAVRTVAITGTARVPPDCDDGNACTDDAFDESTAACTHVPHVRACDDGNACTGGDRCSDGACLGEPLACDDGDACTRDACDPTVGCVHPVEAPQCDDGDPCTTDLCTDSTCAHTTADDGTACGPFSCATAQLCVSGTCRELDVSGASDGVACDDGNACTSGDSCTGGACLGLVGAGGPTIVSRVETFGSGGLASDGFRHVFADRDGRVRIASAMNDELRLVGRLAKAGQVRNFAPGLFLMSTDGWQVALLDATDPALPSVRWEQPLSLRDADDDYDVRPVTGGALLFIHSLPQLGPMRQRVDFLPIAADGTRLGPQRPLLADVKLGTWSTDRTFAAGGSGADGVEWLELSGDGQVVRRVALPLPYSRDSRKVAVHGHRVAVATGNDVEVYAITPTRPEPIACRGTTDCLALAPGCDGTFPYAVGNYRTCLNDGDCGTDARCARVHAGSPEADCSTACCDSPVTVCLTPGGPEASRELSFTISGVSAVALDAHELFFANDAGIYVTPVDPTMLALKQLDGFTATGLSLAPGHLLATGPMALPFRRTGSATTTTLTRVTAAGHGRIQTLQELPSGDIRVAGDAVFGTFGKASGRFDAWRITDAVSSPYAHRLIEGDPRVAVPTVRGGLASGDPCGGVTLDRVATTGAVTRSAMCLGNVSSIAASGDHLLSVNAGPTSEYRIWSFANLAGVPLMQATYEVGLTNLSVRAADRGPSAVVFGNHPNRPAGHIVLLDTWGPDVNAVASIDVATQFYAGDDGYRAVAVQGYELLLADTDRIELHQLPGGAVPTLRASLTIPGTFPRPRIAWMAGGDAWISAYPRTTGAGMRLVQVRYDVATARLEDRGAVELPLPADVVLRTSDATYAATANELVVVAPGCQ